MFAPEGYMLASELFTLVHTFATRKVELIQEDSNADNTDLDKKFIEYNIDFFASDICCLMHKQSCDSGSSIYHLFKPDTPPVGLQIFRPRTLHRWETVSPPPFSVQTITSDSGQVSVIKKKWVEILSDDFWVEKLADFRPFDHIDDPEKAQLAMRRMRADQYSAPIVHSQYFGIQYFETVDVKHGTLYLDSLRASIDRSRRELSEYADLAKTSRLWHDTLEQNERALRQLELFESYPLVIKREHFTEIKDSIEKLSKMTKGSPNRGRPRKVDDALAEYDNLTNGQKSLTWKEKTKIVNDRTGNSIHPDTLARAVNKRSRD